MPRGVKKAREAMVKFRNPADCPAEMRPTGKGADKKGIPVVVLKETAKMVQLQYTAPKRGRAKQVLQVSATFPIEAVVLYNVTAVDVAEVQEPSAPVTKKAAATRKKAAPKKKAAKKKAAPKKKAAKKKATKKKAAPKKTRKKRKAKAEAPVKRRKKKEAPVRRKKGKKGKKVRKKFGGSRRKTSFRLDEDD